MYALRRIKFLSSISAWLSLARLKRYENIHRGQKAVILCNGPSLNSIDFDLLDGVFCFGLNKINLLFNRTQFRPSCIVAVNGLVIRQNQLFFETTNIPIFLDALHARRLMKFHTNHIHLCCYENAFAYRPTKFVSQGGTVTFVALQLAFYMGFAEVALVGCDHYFSTSGRPHEELQGGKLDPNHFDPAYFANQTWQAPDLTMSEKSYAQALEAFQADGRRLVNASTQTKLDILPRTTLTEFLAH